MKTNLYPIICAEYSTYLSVHFGNERFPPLPKFNAIEDDGVVTVRTLNPMTETDEGRMCKALEVFEKSTGLQPVLAA